MPKVKKNERDRIYQGDIFKKIDFVESITEDKTHIVVDRIKYPLVIVLSQDCDLQSNHNCRKLKDNNNNYLISLIVAPLFNYDHFILGAHFSEIGYKMETIKSGKTIDKKLKQNNVPRYHYLNFEHTIVSSVIDFKHFFTVPYTYLKNLNSENYVFSVEPIYRERISQRFANYLSIIGLHCDEDRLSNDSEDKVCRFQQSNNTIV